KDTNVTVAPRPDETLPITESGNEWPNRYMLLSRQALVGWLMAGVGWQPHRAIRFGASFGSGFFTITNKSMVQVQGGSFKSQEVVNTITANDWFLPRATVSMVAQPADSIELFANLMYQSDAHATGHADQVANGIQGAPRTDCYSDKPGPNCRINGAKLTVPFPTFETTLGFRYADRRRARERVLDPMKDERWDIALEGFWSQTSHVDNFTLNLFDANLPMDKRPGIQASSNLDTSRLPIQQSVVIPHRWKDTFGARVGGDWNVVPETLSVRLGLSYSSNAVRPGYANIDSFPMQRIGLHAGLTLAHGRQKITLAYAHLFYTPITVGVGDGKVPAIAAVSPQAALPVNEGYYQAMVDVISLQSNLSF
ncbi:MAG TPA: hypothetical protein VG963_17950, partial [Polyangiaceae bacterium]|nr:hypothetical protein [Polyangiaceae bacterium]